MELLSNPWFIIFTAINIIATIYLAIKFYYRYKKDEPTLYEKLRNAGIHPTVRKPMKENELKGGDTSNIHNNNT
jgi:hypothetical protein